MKVDSKTKHGIPFGWHVPTQRMVSASDVANGRRCECVCVACGARLKARQGEIRIWHFAHDEETECFSGPEAAIHRMAKQMIVDRAALFLPEWVISRSISGVQDIWQEVISVTVQAPGLQSLGECVAEKSVGDVEGRGEYRRPDVLAVLDDHPLAIEVRNTHAVDPDKQQWLARLGHSVLEITVADLAALPPERIFDALTVRLFQSADYSTWLAHANEEAALAALDRLEEAVRAAHQEEEALALARLAAEAADKERKEAARLRFRDKEEFKIRFPRCTIRLGRNEQRVSLKAYGYAPTAVFDGLTQLAHQHQGRFNVRARCWEFYRYAETEAFFVQMRAALQQVCLERFCAVAPVAALPPTDDVVIATPILEPLPCHFQDEALQEAFEERAAILEFEAGLPRAEAETQALALVREGSSQRDA